MLYTPREKDEEENLLLSIAMALTLLFPISGDSGLLSNAGGFLKARKKLPMASQLPGNIPKFD